MYVFCGVCATDKSHHCHLPQQLRNIFRTPCAAERGVQALSPRSLFLRALHASLQNHPPIVTYRVLRRLPYTIRSTYACAFPAPLRAFYVPHSVLPLRTTVTCTQHKYCWRVVPQDGRIPKRYRRTAKQLYHTTHTSPLRLPHLLYSYTTWFASHTSTRAILPHTWHYYPHVRCRGLLRNIPCNQYSHGSLPVSRGYSATMCRFLPAAPLVRHTATQHCHSCSRHLFPTVRTVDTHLSAKRC